MANMMKLETFGQCIQFDDLVELIKYCNLFKIDKCGLSTLKGYEKAYFSLITQQKPDRWTLYLRDLASLLPKQGETGKLTAEKIIALGIDIFTGKSSRFPNERFQIVVRPTMGSNEAYEVLRLKEEGKDPK